MKKTFVFFALMMMSVIGYNQVFDRIKDSVNTWSTDAYYKPAILACNNGTAFFIANGAKGTELWKSDGTVAGTVMVKDIKPSTGSSTPTALTKVNNLVFFAADNGVNGQELWKTDGTEAGTVMVKDINPGPAGSGINALIIINGVALFVAYEPTSGNELWKSDGTEAGTVMVKEIRPGPGSIVNNAGFVEYFNLNSTLYFSANDGVNGYSLWKTDGTSAGTVMVKAGTGIADTYQYVNGLLFFVTGSKSDGFNLWRTDGTEAGTVMLKLFKLSYEENLKPGGLTNLNGTLFFMGQDFPNGAELWKTDGTVAGTVIVKDINPGTKQSIPSTPVNLNNKLYFSATDGIHGRELWTSDGTEAGTVMLKDIYPGSNNSYPQNLVKFNDKIYFTAVNGTNGYELWKTDGTSAGTIMLKDMNPGPGDGLTGYDFKIINDRLMFSGNDGIHGFELWRSNGEADGTIMLEDIVPGSIGSYPYQIINADGTIYFFNLTSYNDAYNRKLVAGKLPVSPLQFTWLEFSGQKINNDALLTWKIANEMNTDKFTVERSLNGRDYSAIGSKLAYNGSGTYQYNFTDPQINLLGADIIYYRLKQIDFNGNYTYSRIVAISLTGRNVLMIYPNPTIGNTNITITTNNTEAIQLRVINNLGQIIKQQQLGVTTGSITLSLDVSGLAKGMYYLEVKGATVHETKQFLKL
jgi:trimeric autotransporter adhesin